MSTTETIDTTKPAVAPASKTAEAKPVKAAPKAAKPVKATKAATAAPAAPAKKVAAKKAVKAAAPKPTPAAKKPAVRTAPVAKPKAAATPAAPKDPAKAKQKLVRDSFTMPRGDFALINTLKERALGFRRPTKKSELLRAGLHALAALPDAKLKQVLDGLVPLKTGRPKKGE